MWLEWGSGEGMEGRCAGGPGHGALGRCEQERGVTWLMCGERGSEGHCEETSEVALVPVQAEEGRSWTGGGSGGRGQRAGSALVLPTGGLRVRAQGRAWTLDLALSEP